MILYQPCPVRTFSVAVKENPYARDDPFRFEEYDAIVIGAGMSLITVVTPDLDSEFSKNVIKCLILSFGRNGTVLKDGNDSQNPS